MNETVIPDSTAIADAMLKRIGEVLRDRAAAKEVKSEATPPMRLASYFANEAPDGAKPHYSQVAEEFSHFPDVFPLYFTTSDPRVANVPARLTRERVSELWDGMGGYAEFCKQWGYQQFAQAIEDEVRTTLLAAMGLRETDEQPVCATCHGARRVVTGTSGRDSDGNAPDIDPCPFCEEPS